MTLESFELETLGCDGMDNAKEFCGKARTMMGNGKAAAEEHTDEITPNYMEEK